MSKPNQPFLETLYHMRTVEHIILYNKLGDIPHSEVQDTMAFLEDEYERERQDYPYTAPLFDAEAAIWGAKTVYSCAQLLLYRENKAVELPSLVPQYSGVLDASAMLSADLCFRFLPSVKHALELIDVNDPLIKIIEGLLVQFPYSGIGRDGDFTVPNVSVILQDNCLKQLYLDRITQRKALKWTAPAEITTALMANMGSHKNDLWREFNN